MVMENSGIALRVKRFALAAALIVLVGGVSVRGVSAQAPSTEPEKSSAEPEKSPAEPEKSPGEKTEQTRLDNEDDKAERARVVGKGVSAERTRLDADAVTGGERFADYYKAFYFTYRLGADDVIAVRVLGEPDHSSESIKVSPLGRIYLPLVGDVEVAGMTVPQLLDKLTNEFGEYVKSPKVSVDLVTANSAKIGVLGEVGNPGIVVLARPMNVLDAISNSGGFTDFGSRSNVTVLRQTRQGDIRTLEIDVKRIMEGKAKPEENITLIAGDTVVVHGNKKKAINTFMSTSGLGGFMNFLRMGQSVVR
jgi:polysaccharide export outer membrane protein